MMVLDDLLDTLDMDATVKDVRLGLFHTGVITRNCGLASTLPRDSLKQRPLFAPLVKEPGFLLEKSAAELCRLCRSDNIPEAAIGMATVNSLIEIDEKLCTVLNAGDLIAERGDSTPLSPVLFDHGVDVVAGTQVIDPQLAMRCVSQGATFRQVKGRRPLTMAK